MNLRRSTPFAITRVIAAAIALGLLGIITGSRAAERDAVVATVNGYPIELSYIYGQVETLPLGDQIQMRQQLDRFIDSVIQEEVLFQSLLASNFEGEPELREQVKATVVEHLIQRYVTERIDVTEDQIRTYYDENRSIIRGEDLSASQIVLAHRRECEALLSQLDSKEAFMHTAKERSLDPESGQRGGFIGWFMNHAGPFGFEDHLFEMEPGEMRVFDTEQGCHLVRLDERVTPPMPPLETVETRIREFLESQQEVDLLRELLAERGKGLAVERAGE